MNKNRINRNQRSGDRMGNNWMGGNRRGGHRGYGIRAALTAALLAAVLTACGSTKSTYGDTAAATEEIAYEEESAAYDAGAGVVYNEAAQYKYADAPAEEPVSEGSSEQSAPVSGVQAAERKLIKTVNISAETEAFDTLVPGLQEQVEALGGYIERISVYDVDSYYVEERLQKRRCADITARVPKEALDGFLAKVGEQTNVTSRSESVEDVTLQYVDLESHKKALLTEQDRLLELMARAESVEDIIAIEGRLSEVRYQLESMESQLRTYDNQIDYSTVYLSIAEVRSYSAPQTATAWQRIQSGFTKSLEDIGFGIRDMAISFVINLPYILIGLLVIVAVFFILRAIVRRFARNKALGRSAGRLRGPWRGKAGGGRTAEEAGEKAKKEEGNKAVEKEAAEDKRDDIKEAVKEDTEKGQE